MRRVYKFLVATVFYFYNALVTHIPFYGLRHAYLRVLLRVRVGPGTAIHMRCFVTGNRITIGNHTVLNRRCYLDGRGGLRIGDNVNVSPEVYLLSLTHDLRDPAFPPVAKEVVIEDDVWIGARAMILPGVTLHRGCVVGAGAVVASDVPPFAIVGGVPAKKIGDRPPAVGYTTRYFPFYDTDIIP
jgi:acetyltransferase-like isoleucine patch superfamily enzyme